MVYGVRVCFRGQGQESVLTTEAWIPNPSNAFLYISRLFLALLVTKRIFLPTWRDQKSIHARLNERELTSGSEQGEDVCDARNEGGPGPDHAVTVEEKGVEFIEEGGILFGGVEALGGGGHGGSG